MLYALTTFIQWLIGTTQVSSPSPMWMSLERRGCATLSGGSLGPSATGEVCAVIALDLGDFVFMKHF